MLKSTLFDEEEARDVLLATVGLCLATLEAALLRLAADDLRDLLLFFAIRDHSYSRQRSPGNQPAIASRDCASIMLPWSPQAARGLLVRCGSP